MAGIYRTRRGMTVIELLAAMGVAVILVSLLMLAVQQARGSARRLQCMNQSKQVALGLHLHEGAFGRLPSGTEGFEGRYPFRSWLSQILVFVEREALDSEVVNDYARSKYPFSPVYHRHLKSSVALFECPEDPRSGRVNLSRQYQMFVGLTSYMGNHGTDYSRNDGVLYYESTTRFSDLRRGLSNTLMFGERPASAGNDFGWWYAGAGFYETGAAGVCDHTLCVERNPPSRFGGCDPREALFQHGRLDNECDADHFWSLHQGGAHFARCDGSIAFFSYGSDAILRGMASR